jgi:hypothetical protein
MKKVFLFVAVCLCGVLSAFGQTGGTITGTVADASGAVIPGVSIQAKNIATGTTYQVGSSETGNFTLPNLPVGTYELSASLPGFKTFVRPNITIAADNVVRIDAKLEVGSAGDTVTVEAAAPLLKTETGEVSHNVDVNLLNQLPVLTLGAGTAIGNIRNPLQSIQLLPGAAFANDNTLRINGMPSSSQAIRIEGQDATNGIWRQQNQQNQPSVDAMQEVAVQTGNFDAEYGQAGGGVFQYTMKSGTNDFHGGVFDYFVNEFLNAGTPFTDRITIGDTARAGQHLRNTQRRNDYGFNFGGPILLGHMYDGHNKSFFFFNFEQFRENQFITTGLTTVPLAAYTKGDFHSALVPCTPPQPPAPPDPTCQPYDSVVPFAKVLTQNGAVAHDPANRVIFQNAIYDPSVIHTAADGTTYRDPFPGNVITSAMDPTALKIQALLPTANNGSITNNYTIPGYNNFRHTSIPSFKIDHNINAQNHLSFYYSDTITNSPGANGFTQVFSAAAPQATHADTFRLNYDRTLSPTKLLHLGAGYLYQFVPSVPVSFDPNSLGMATNFFAPIFPNIGGISDTTRGGAGLGIGSGFAYKFSKEMKPTGNATFTWVTGNHSIKMGAELVVDGIQTLNYTRANGVYSFSAEQTSIGTWGNGKGFNTTTGGGFGYASFLLGRASGLNISQLTDSRLGNHSLAFYAQDSWKVTRKLTVNYGLRYDLVTLLREQYGRMQSANFTKPNPVANNLPGAVDYEANCHCRFGQTYPWALGPRLSFAYQVADKTVIRAGSGLAYGTSPNNAFLSLSVPDFYNISAPQYADPAVLLKEGNVFGPGNDRGNAPLTWPDYTRSYPFETAPGIRPPASPFIFIDRHAGRPPRILQWSFDVQRQVTSNLLVDVGYVANRGVWWSAPVLQSDAYNALTLDDVKRAGLDITNAADRALLNAPISSASVLARFPQLANPNIVYPGFPSGQALKQVLRPHPQWGAGIPPFLGPPLGDTWYDSLQVKVTQRLTHNLTASGAYTYGKELTSGANSDTSYLTPNPPLINDVFNRAQAKQLSSFGHPNAFVVSFNYMTPGLTADSGAMKVVSSVLHDWTMSGVLRYQSGDLIRTPPSTNALLTALGRGAENNPAVWGGGTTFWNKVDGQPLLLKDPNCHCIDPTKDLVLNPKAWTDAAPGTFGVSAPYNNDYRWQRQPSEALSFGRRFQLAKQDRPVFFDVRAEFQNVFNRLFLQSPSVGGPTGVSPATFQTNDNKTGLLTGGYGFVNYVSGGTATSGGARPRGGQIVARITF